MQNMYQCFNDDLSSFHFKTHKTFAFMNTKQNRLALQKLRMDVSSILTSAGLQKFLLGAADYFPSELCLLP